MHPQAQGGIAIRGARTHNLREVEPVVVDIGSRVALAGTVGQD